MPVRHFKIQTLWGGAWIMHAASLPIRVVSRFIPRIAASYYPVFDFAPPTRKITVRIVLGPPRKFLAWHSNFRVIPAWILHRSSHPGYPQLSKRLGRAWHSTIECVAAYVKKCSNFHLAMPSTLHKYKSKLTFSRGFISVKARQKIITLREKLIEKIEYNTLFCINCNFEGI